MLIEALLSLLYVVGGAFALIGAIGLVRLPDIFMRLHGPTKASTLGIGAIVVAVLLHTNLVGDELSLKELAIPLFLFITAPLSAHVVAKAAEKAQRRD
jgi:multicomponent K+:H+ antiporter subunit G